MFSECRAHGALAPVLAGLAAPGLVHSARGQQFPPENFMVAFIGDQGAGVEARAVLEMIAAEGADAVVHAGGFDYENDPAAWDGRITEVLGADFPWFAAVGDEDDRLFHGAGGYQSYLQARMARLGIPWEGDLGVRSTHHFQGIFFVLTAPGVFGDGDDEYAPYIAERLAADHSAWRISSWHLLMNQMQVGVSPDQTGWGVYEESRRGGAIIATAQEHSYARTHPLRNCTLQIVDKARDAFEIWQDHPKTPGDEGVTFVFHGGLGGAPIGAQERCLPTSPPYGCNGEWASIYTSDQGANHGALFAVFNTNGDPCRAQFYFKDINGGVPDEFLVRSRVGPCLPAAPCPGDLDGDSRVDGADLSGLIRAWGRCGALCPADLDGNGVVDIRDLLGMLARWGLCGA